MKRLLCCAVLALIPSPALTQNALLDPPRDAIEIGLLLDQNSGLIQVRQQQNAIAVTCGANEPFGCITWLTQADGARVCQIHIWIGLEGGARTIVYENLVAQCGGWAPTLAQAGP